MLDDALVADDLEQLHHPAIFVSEDVAVLHVLAGEINKSGSHREVTGCLGIARGRIQDDRAVLCLCYRNREVVPPDWRPHDDGLRVSVLLLGCFLLSCIADDSERHGHFVWIEDLNNVKRVSNAGLVVNRPLFRGIEEHYLIDYAVAELLAVNGVLRRRSVRVSPGGGSALVPTIDQSPLEMDITLLDVIQKRRHGWKVTFSLWKSHRHSSAGNLNE